VLKDIVGTDEHQVKLRPQQEFGAATIAGEAVVSVPSTATTFALAVDVMTDREIAQAINEVGYTTTGNRGVNAFTNDSYRFVLQSRFYLGE
jgi:hypothetical protein